MSNYDRDELIEEIGRGLMRLQSAVDDVDEAAAEYLGVNRTDLRCLGLVVTRGPMTAGELAEATRLTAGALTTALDRLERAGYARRVRDLADRRRVLVEPTDNFPAVAEEIWGETGKEMVDVLLGYSTDELVTAKNFVEQVVGLHVRHTALILEKKRKATGKPEADVRG
ncbi:MarR family winged helix-turn-helix transcriptional regulator [Amycolatopsis rubida]|uniref:DNA-binding transcriptional regulator, MarR family n=1 Tax=Amycolatopsis rubida TaxID=112413 RepID=A0A1I5TJ11_9PSEU|nr:MarR family transcriptional regulator [Amycolatopsis rubida]SFP83054.1 DNA-binding transcriptional regulator, MarR family [Amycolatopsis rubida]